MNQSKLRSIQSFSFPPVIPECAQYLEVLPPLEKNYEDNIKKMKKQQQILKNLVSKIVSKIAREINSLQDLVKNRAIPSQSINHKIIWAQKKYFRLFYKYHSLKVQKYQKIYGEATDLVKFFERSINIKAPVIFKQKAFFDNCKEINKHQIHKNKFKLTAILSFINSFPENERIHKNLRAKQLLKLLIAEAKNVNESLAYIPPNCFDDQFQRFAYETGLIKRFEQFSDAMPQYGSTENPEIKPNDIPDFNIPEMPVQILKEAKTNEIAESTPLSNLETFSPNFDLVSIAPPVLFDDAIEDEFEEQRSASFQDFNSFVKFFFVALDSDAVGDKSVFTVMRCAAIRTLFDVYFIRNDKVFLGPLCSRKFLSNSDKILNQTPADFGLSEKVVPRKFQQTPMRDLLRAFDDFECAVEQIWKLQFFVNPLDISFCTFDAMKSVERGIREITNAKRNDVIGLSFDDLFDFVLPAFAMEPHPSPVALHRFLSNSEDLQLSTSLEYANVSIKAAITHITNYENGK